MANGGSGAVISMESSPKPMRGLLSGFVQSGFTVGFLLASISFQLTQFAFPDDKFIEVGWRVYILYRYNTRTIGIVRKIKNG